MSVLQCIKQVKEFDIQPLKSKFHKMVKHTHTIFWQFAKDLFNCVWPFCGIGA